MLNGAADGEEILNRKNKRHLKRDKKTKIYPICHLNTKKTGAHANEMILKTCKLSTALWPVQVFETNSLLSLRSTCICWIR
jgi:hypothetical protein